MARREAMNKERRSTMETLEEDIIIVVKERDQMRVVYVEMRLLCLMV